MGVGASECSNCANVVSGVSAERTTLITPPVDSADDTQYLKDGVEAGEELPDGSIEEESVVLGGGKKVFVESVEEDFTSSAACCLCWTLSATGSSLPAGMEEEQLLLFHEEVGGLLGLFNAQMLEDGATSGLILGRPLVGGEMSAADIVVRLGQLMCRWAASQSPVLRLCVGVHIGTLQAMSLRNSGGRRSYFGAACAGAWALAETSFRDNMVYISPEVKANLSCLRLLRVTLDPGSSCFYIDPHSDAARPLPQRGASHRGSRMSMSLDLEGAEQELKRAKMMPLADFEALLETHKVDVSRFGQGDAKTLQEFYEAVVREEKSFLVSSGDTLHRVVELVRISLRIRGSDQMLHELRIKSEQNAEGGERQRNQPLAVVLHKADGGRWRDAVTRCFELKFGLSEEQQEKLFNLEADAYSVEKQTSNSQTIPGILTMYKRHSVVLTVRDREAPALKIMGLPDATDFSTGAAGDGTNRQNWTWAVMTDSREAELTKVLQKGGIDVSEFSWQAFADLYEEVFEKSMSSLEEDKSGELVRTVKIVKVWLHAGILSLDHVLVLRSKRDIRDKPQLNTGRAITMRMEVHQTCDDAVSEVLMSRLGITPSMQQECLAIDMASRRHTEDVTFSRSFPGLKTLYIISEVHVSVLEPQDRRWRFLGLPGGTDFTFTRQEAVMASRSKLTVTHWSWEPVAERSLTRSFEEDHLDPIWSASERTLTVKSAPTERTLADAHKVTSPLALQVRETDELLLFKLMLGRGTNWTRARNAADRILDADYTTKQYYEDVCHAFPELRLYCISREEIQKTMSGRATMTPLEGITTSGARMTADDEYQRTIGALLTIFWLMRLHIDGKECFCFGVDGAWKPRSMSDHSADEVEFNKRKAFYELTDWDALERLMIGAGLLQQAGGPHDPDRTLAMLVLMSIHDVMKLDILLPSVGKHLNEFRGYKSGETILDHDAALSYVMDHCPQALPSYMELPEEQKGTVSFTHSALDYNMGWLVQGEAPPGILFRSFRKVVIAGNATPNDIAFYFVHWFADLAGAEPKPLNGCEKFVIKFPRKVLGCFIDSFAYVKNLGPDKTETGVYEEYLEWRWTTHDPDLGPAPTGKGAIAQMRLVLMAQADSHEVLRTFAALPEDDRRVLENELVKTGCHNQEFQRERARPAGSGPAMLIYYAPALLQKAGRKDLRGTMIILAEVLRQARKLWPLSDKPEDADRSVTIRIDALKDLEVSELLSPEAGYGYLLRRSSSQDGLVQLVSMQNFKSLDWSCYQILELGETKSTRTRQRSATRQLPARMPMSPRRVGNHRRTNTVN